MTLENFETQINSTIVKRGYDYYQEEAVENLEEITNGQWSASVIGSEEYAVRISLTNNEIVSWECDCPYDLGPICKHVVAALFSIKEEFTLMETENAAKKSKPKNTIEALLQKVSHKELKEFVITQLHQHTEVKNAFITTFADKQEGESHQKYVKLIQSIVHTTAGRHGFIDYRSAMKLTRQLMELCDKASLLLSNNLTESLAITQAIIEEMPEIVMGMDDSDGGAGDIWEVAFENFSNIIEKAPPLLKDELFEYCNAQFRLQKYHDAGFDDHFIDIMPLLVNSREQEQRFFKLIEDRINIEQSNKYGEYAVVSLLKAKIRFLEDNDRHQEALSIISNNIALHDFREVLIEKAIKQTNYSEARELCHAGITIANTKQHPGVVNRFKHKLLEIAELEKDLTQIHKWTETLFFENHYSFEYYLKLKKYWDKDKWPGKCEEIITKIKKPMAKGDYYDADVLARVFVEEEYYDRLLLLLQINGDYLRFIDSFSQHLANLYPAEIIQLYEKAIAVYAEGSGRDVYENVASYLEKLVKIKGGLITVTKLVNQFREKYRNRRAMIEVLNKHFT